MLRRSCPVPAIKQWGPSGGLKTPSLELETSSLKLTSSKILFIPGDKFILFADMALHRLRSDPHGANSIHCAPPESILRGHGDHAARRPGHYSQLLVVYLWSAFATRYVLWETGTWHRFIKNLCKRHQPGPHLMQLLWKSALLFIAIIYSKLWVIAVLTPMVSILSVV